MFTVADNEIQNTATIHCATCSSTTSHTLAGGELKPWLCYKLDSLDPKDATPSGHQFVAIIYKCNCCGTERVFGSMRFVAATPRKKRKVAAEVATV